MLDATAGNRMMWSNKNPPDIIFMDRETRLAVPPDIFADNRYCPFRDDVFSCVIYDPPHYYHSNPMPWFNNPTIKDGWYGILKTKRAVLANVHYAQEEFKRLTKRLCLKWNDDYISLWKILPFFKEWKEIHRLEKKSMGHKRKNVRAKTYWVTFVRTSCQSPSSIRGRKE